MTYVYFLLLVCNLAGPGSPWGVECDQQLLDCVGGESAAAFGGFAQPGKSWGEQEATEIHVFYIYNTFILRSPSCLAQCLVLNAWLLSA